jgi:hypothetical protein
MDNNIFRLQLAGTAMGTPVACSYATISFGHHENTKILEEFQPNLLYYKRYIGKAKSGSEPGGYWGNSKQL